MTTEAPSATPKPAPALNSYTAVLVVDPTARAVSGSEKITYNNNSEKMLSEIKINTYMNAFTEHAAQKPYFPEQINAFFPLGFEYARFEILSVTAHDAPLDFVLEETTLTVFLPEELPPGGAADINLSFAAYVPIMNARTGANEYSMWFGGFLPILAVFDGESWHSDPYYPVGDPFYSEAANYEVTVTTPKGCAVITTGAETYYETDEVRVTTTSAKMVRDFSFTVSPFYTAQYAKTPSGKYINFYAYSELDDEKKQGYIDATIRSMEYFTSIAGAHPSTAVDIVETTLFTPGAVSYPSLIFLDFKSFGEEADDDVNRAIAHEIGHQWFSVLIGSDSVHEQWLTEGITALLDNYVFLDEDGVYSVMRGLYESVRGLVLGRLTDDLSVYGSWEACRLVQRAKSSLMFYALKQKIGNAAWAETIKRYAVEYSYKIAAGGDFLRIAAETGGTDLTDFFDEWNGYGIPDIGQKR
ncbi:peptidase [Clostridia bacterium]|nr:peptidase [Clostridia bacterium]